jgi:hypothetical protein
MLKIPHCIDNRLTVGEEVVSPTHWPLSTPLKHYFPASGPHFCYRLSKRHDLVRPEGLGELKKKTYYLIGSRTRDLPACSTVPQPLQCDFKSICMYNGSTDVKWLRNSLQF